LWHKIASKFWPEYNPQRSKFLKRDAVAVTVGAGLGLIGVNAFDIDHNPISAPTETSIQEALAQPETEVNIPVSEVITILQEVITKDRGNIFDAARLESTMNGGGTSGLSFASGPISRTMNFDSGMRLNLLLADYGGLVRIDAAGRDAMVLSEVFVKTSENKGMKYAHHFSFASGLVESYKAELIRRQRDKMYFDIKVMHRSEIEQLKGGPEYLRYWDEQSQNFIYSKGDNSHQYLPCFLTLNDAPTSPKDVLEVLVLPEEINSIS